jgi:hypothetical protein
MVTTDYAIELIDKLITRHPEKERIIKELTEEGIIIERPQIKGAPIIPILEEVVERPSPPINKEEVLKKIEELRKESYGKK